MDGPVDRIEVHRRMHRRQLRAVLHMQINRLLTQVGEEVGLPVPLQARWIQRIEQALEHRPRDRPGKVHYRGAKGTNWFEKLVGLVQRAAAAPHDRAHLLQVKLFWEGWGRWHRDKREPAIDLFGSVQDEVAPELHDVCRLFERPEHRPTIHRADGMQLEQERGDNAEVAATTAYCPEQVGMLLGAGRDEAAIGEYHVNAKQVVDRQAQCSREVADASTQCQSTDTGTRNEAAGSGQPEGVRGMVHLAPGAATFDASSARGRINAHTLHARQVDHQAVIAGTQAGAAVPAASHGQRQLVLAGEVDRRDHIGHIHAAGDQGGSFLDHAVVDADSLLVASITGTKQLSAHARYKLLERRFLQSDWGGLLFHHTFLLVYAVK